MFNPVGPKRPAVYWRRRVVLLAFVVLVLVLLIVTVRGMTGRSAAAPAAAAASSSAPRAAAPRSSAIPARSSATPSSSAPLAVPGARASSSGTAASGSATGSPSASSSPPPRPCRGRDLRIAALPTQSHFSVGSEPVLGVEVTDVGSAPCVQDLSDRQVLLQVYSGATRVWSSHDCAVQPGTDLRTLTVGRPVRVALAWSGMTSAPGCGARQRVGAGSYTLYASLSGRTGTAATFTLS